MDSELKQTPLNRLHRDLGGRMVPFGGWDMPIQYSSILEEHRAVREAAGLFDVSHMGEALVIGKEAESYLNYMATNKVAGLPVGKALYTVLCHPHGGCVDDVILYRLEPECFLVVLNASNTDKDLQWLESHTAGFDVTVTDQSADWAQLALQGPRTLEILQPLAKKSLTELKRFHCEKMEVTGVEVLVARTGYTGEDGVEIYLPAADGAPLFAQLLEAGREKGLLACGLGARDSLRLEAGYPLYGHEITDKVSPLEAGLGWVVKLKKPDAFLGKEALAKQAETGPQRKTIFYRLNNRRIARAGESVYCGDEVIGEVVSGTLSPLLNQPIGSARIKSVADTTNLSVRLRGNEIPLEVARPPLHKQTSL